MNDQTRVMELGEGDSFTASWGARFYVERGTLFNELPKLATVGVHDLADVAEHDIVRVAGVSSHFVRFHDGGFLRFAFNEQGALLELSGERVRVSLNSSGQMMVGAFGRVDEGR